MEKVDIKTTESKQTSNANMQWYSLRVISGKEKTIEQSIEKEVERMLF